MTNILSGVFVKSALALVAGAVIVLNRDGTTTEVEVPDCSHARVSADGKVEVTIPPRAELDSAPERRRASVTATSRAAKVERSARKREVDQGMVPKGMRVVPITLYEIRMGGLMLPGEHVDVQLHFRNSNDRQSDKSWTETIMEDVAVFAVDDNIGVKEANCDPGGLCVSLLVTPKQAEQLQAAAQLGTFHLIMRTQNEQAITPAVVTPRGLLNSGNAKPTSSPEPASP